jgi:hypothetical protein
MEIKRLTAQNKILENMSLALLLRCKITFWSFKVLPNQRIAV